MRPASAGPLAKPSFDWPTLRDAVANEVTRLSGLYRKGLEGAKVAIREERAVVAGPNSVAPRPQRRDRPRPPHPGRDRRLPRLRPADPRRRTRHLLQRDLPPAEPAEAHARRRRRLYRARIRQPLRAARCRRHGAAPRRQHPARLRRGHPQPAARRAGACRHHAAPRLHGRAHRAAGGRGAPRPLRQRRSDRRRSRPGRHRPPPEHRRARPRRGRRRARAGRRGRRRRQLRSPACRRSMRSATSPTAST